MQSPQPSPYDEVLAALRSRGERLTPQRLIVIQVFQEHPGHLTAETIHGYVAMQYPYINRVTVYRTLQWLAEQGLVSVTDLGHGQTEYEYLLPQRHHHLICLDCGTTAQMAHTLVAPLVAAIEREHGFHPRLEHLAVFGYCARCDAARQAAAHTVSEDRIVEE